MLHVNGLLEVSSPEGPLAFGEQPTLADLAAAPHLLRMAVLSHYDDWKIPADDPEFSRVHQWQQAVLALPTVRETSLPMEQYIELYCGFVAMRQQNVDTTQWKKPSL